MEPRQEPLSKDLGFGISTSIDKDGNLTLTEEYTTYDAFDEEEPANTVIMLPPQAVRALHNFLRRADVRSRTGYRKQKEGKRHGTTNKTRRLGHLQRLIGRWLRQARRP